MSFDPAGVPTTPAPSNAVGATLPPPAPPTPAAAGGRRGNGRQRSALTFVAGAGVAGLAALAVAGWTRDTGSHSSPATTVATDTHTVSNPPASGNSATTDVSALVAKVRTSVVSIAVTAIQNDGAGSSTVQAAGSGFVFGSDGLIATNAHVVDGATTVKVTFDDGSTKDAKVVGIDHTDDLAVVKVDASGLTPVPIGDSASLKVGQTVVAIGNALDLSGGPTASEGIVSALDRSIDTENGEHLNGLVQTDAPINPGNSGGPLLDLAGNVVGIDTAAADSAQNIGFAIGISQAQPLLQQLADGKAVTRPFLGVKSQLVDQSVAQQLGLSVDHGELIVAVTDGSPAESAGLQQGDVITKVGDTEIKAETDLRDAITQAGVGKQLALTVQRGDQVLHLTATVGSHNA